MTKFTTDNIEAVEREIRESERQKTIDMIFKEILKKENQHELAMYNEIQLDNLNKIREDLKRRVEK